jgi:hypothetical protein
MHGSGIGIDTRIVSLLDVVIAMAVAMTAGSTGGVLVVMRIDEIRWHRDLA